jgi:hypothetical protein
MLLRSKETALLLRRNGDDETSNFTTGNGKLVEKDSLHISPIV